jgi:hypothetical protein
MMNKGDGVSDDGDDDVAKTRKSPDRVTVTLCTKELFLSRCIYSSPHISEKSNFEGGGE